MTDHGLKHLKEPLQLVRKEVESLLGLLTRHYGPGPHPGTGTSQDVHGGLRGTGFFSWQDRYIEHIPKHMGKRDIPEGMMYQPARWLGLHSEGMGDVFRELAKQYDYGGRIDWNYIEEKLLRFEKDMSYERDREWIFRGELSPADEGRRKELLTLWRAFPGAMPPALEVARQLNLRLLERDETGVILAISDVRSFAKSGALLVRHYGPGPHPGTGTPQDVHGGGKGRSLRTGIFDPDDIERVAPMRGFCFERCAEWLVLEQGKEYEQASLVHGTVMGQGPLEGVRFTHAWVEIDDWVYDVSQDILSPKGYYYELAQAEDMVSYTGTEASVNLLKEKNWGPWEEKLYNFKEKEIENWIKSQ